ncbi:MAG: amidohydrolase family protein, partial [Desulfobacterales bacterium]|nr:amidohydrolase family protein [Desulfobacterales bacterium]
ENSTLVVKDNVIESVGKTDERGPQDSNLEDINLDGMTLMPGLIDTHIHLVGDGEVSVFVNLFESSMKRCVKAVRYLHNILEMGITTVRSGGDGNDYFEMALRDSIRENFIEGPLLLATGYHLTATGGHAYFLPPWTNEVNCVGMRCDGEDSFQKAARMQLAYGADSVKITSGRGLEEADDPRIAELTVEEIRAAVNEAHQRGKLAIAHAMGPTAIKNALIAGVDSIVHGFWLDEECAEIMAAKGIFWEPTIRYPWRIAEDGGKSGTPDFYVKNCRMAVEALQNNLQRWVKAGVKITLGTDAGGVPLFTHGENAEELEYMVRLGINPLDAIIASTKHSAECLHLDHRLGTLAPGKEADLLIVEGNPLSDIKILSKKEKIRGVLRGGKKVVWRLPKQE